MSDIKPANTSGPLIDSFPRELYDGFCYTSVSLLPTKRQAPSEDLLDVDDAPPPPQQQTSAYRYSHLITSTGNIVRIPIQKVYNDCAGNITAQRPVTPPTSPSGLRVSSEPLATTFGLLMARRKQNYQIATSIQHNLTREKRGAIITIITTISDYFRFHRETLWVAMLFFDRYLANVKVTHLKQFRLVAIACLYIASKIEEEELEPTCKDLAESSILASADDLRRMEKKVLNGIGWNFTYVTPHALMCCIAQQTMSTRCRNSLGFLNTILDHAKPLLDKCMRDFRFVTVDPCVVAVVCLDALLDEYKKLTESASEFRIRMRLFVNNHTRDLQTSSELFWRNVHECKQMLME